MKHVASTIHSVEDLQRFLQDNIAQIEGAHSILAQVFVSKVDADWIQQLCEAIKSFSQKIAIIGATTAGEICGGRSHMDSCVISLSLFEATQIFPITMPIPPLGEKASGEALVNRLSALSPRIDGLILFSTPLNVDCNILLKTIYDLSPGLPLIGGGAGDYGQLVRSFVFTNDEILESGLVAAALIGSTLHLSRHAFLGWKPIGKAMKVTKVHGLAVQEAIRHSMSSGNTWVLRLMTIYCSACWNSRFC